MALRLLFGRELRSNRRAVTRPEFFKCSQQSKDENPSSSVVVTQIEFTGVFSLTEKSTIIVSNSILPK